MTPAALTDSARCEDTADVGAVMGVIVAIDRWNCRRIGLVTGCAPLGNDGFARVGRIGNRSAMRCRGYATGCGIGIDCISGYVMAVIRIINSLAVTMDTILVGGIG